MLAKQLSVFLENKSGRLNEVTEVLGKAGVNLSAMSIADNSDFGILRCIVSDPEKAKRALEEAYFTVIISDVIGFTCPNTSGALAVVLKYLSERGVFIEYMYSFAAGDVAHVVIRPTDLESCERYFQRRKLTSWRPTSCTSSDGPQSPVFQKMVFRVPKGRLSQLKMPSSATQKTAFYKALSKNNYVSGHLSPKNKAANAL